MTVVKFPGRFTAEEKFHEARHWMTMMQVFYSTLNKADLDHCYNRRMALAEEIARDYEALAREEREREGDGA